MATGFLDASGDPHIRLTVSGPVTQGTEIDFLIDTGYQGFVSIPVIQAFPVGLILHGTTNIVLANGQTRPRLMCLGRVECDGVREVGLIVIENTGQTPLLGMGFLRRFRKRLTVDSILQTVELTTIPTPPTPTPAPTHEPQEPVAPDPEAT